MSARIGQVTDEYDRGVPGATIYVYNEDGTSAALTSDGTTPLAQPITTDQFGNYSYYANSGVYREDTWFGGKMRFREVVAVGLDGLYPPTPRAGQFFAFDALGNPIASAGTGADAGLRTDLAANTGAGLIGWLSSAASAVARTLTSKLREASLSPEDFGAKGDGVTDDYAAFALFCAAISNSASASAKLGKGKTYLINQKVAAGNGITDLIIQSAVGLTIEGNGAIISIKGDFDRDVSTTRQLSIMFQNCSQVTLCNYEVNGHVDLMTNSSNSTEGVCYGHYFGGCDQVKAENVYIHHMATDNWSCQAGVSAGGVRKACRRITLINCRGEYAARCAISPLEVRGLFAVGCTFGYTARYTGTYGFGGAIGHAPKSSLDIEPDFNTATASPNTMDINTGEITFERCSFPGSVGAIWTAVLSASISDVTFRDCQGDGSSIPSAAAAVVLAVPNVVVDNCTLNLGDGYMQFCHSSDPNVTGRINGGSIKGSYMLLQSQLNSGRVHIKDVDFINTNVAPYSHNSATNPPLLAGNTNMAFDNCRLFVPKEAFATGGAGDAMQVAGLGGVRRLRDFRFETDLPANQYGATTAHYHPNNFSGTITPELSNIHFVGTATGVADTFRVAASSTFDTTNKFNRTPGHAGAIGKRALTDAAATHTHSIDPSYAELAVPLTANRVLTLSATNAVRGAEVKVTRTAASTGAFTLTVGAKALATGQWCLVRYNGAAWDNIMFGSL